MGTSPVYDEIGLGYAVRRRPDPRIARAIDAALGDARSVVNVGAGAGSYEPSHLRVTAVEPSLAMIRQRPLGAAPVVQAVAEHLPFADASFDAALAVLTLHHWTDRAGGLARARPRGAPPRGHPHLGPGVPGSLLAHDRVPARDPRPRPPPLPARCRTSPAASRRWTRSPVLVPHDCVDGFLGAFWRRPEAYLDPAVRAGVPRRSPSSPRRRVDAGPGAARRGPRRRPLGRAVRPPARAGRAGSRLSAPRRPAPALTGPP